MFTPDHERDQHVTDPLATQYPFDPDPYPADAPVPDEVRRDAARFALDGLCRSIIARQPAVIGPHEHWDGAEYQTCALAERCPAPSCHPAEPAA